CILIKWVGQHTALKLIKQHGSIQEMVKKGVEIRGNKIQLNGDLVEKIIQLYKNPEVKENYGDLKWNSIRFERLKEMMIQKHNFSEKRVVYALTRLRN
ncbi:MAG: hypothetical protein ACOC44_18790, partial [Promethearchaeia archaeon]